MNFSSVLDDEFDFVENERPGSLMVANHNKIEQHESSIIYETSNSYRGNVKFSIADDYEEDVLNSPRKSAMRGKYLKPKKMSNFSPRHNTMTYDPEENVLDIQLGQKESFEFTTND